MLKILPMSGNYFEIPTDTDHIMTSLTAAEDFHYIYIDDSASSYPTPTIIDSTNEPAWSDAKQGWYYGYDRCIGVVWSASGSATILKFENNKDKYIVAPSIATILENGTPNSTWQVLTNHSNYVPVNAIASLVLGVEFDSNSTTHLFFSSAEFQEASVGGLGYAVGGIMCWTPLGESRDIAWWGAASDDYCESIRVHGYQIDR